MPADRLELNLNADAPAGVTDLAGNRLDGEWVDGVTTGISGDNVPGGDFVYHFNVLPGDANRNGSVDALDAAAIRRSYGFTTGLSAYSITTDLDGNGRINATDVLLVRANQRRRLPEAAAILSP